MNILGQPVVVGEAVRIRSIRTLLMNHTKLFNFLFVVDHSELRAEPEALLCAAGGFSHGEIVLIMIALDIWCDGGGVSLAEAFTVLDSANWRNFIEALKVLGELNGD